MKTVKRLALIIQPIPRLKNANQLSNVCKFWLQLSRRIMLFYCKNAAFQPLSLQNQREQFDAIIQRNASFVHRLADVTTHKVMYRNTRTWIFTTSLRKLAVRDRNVQIITGEKKLT